MEKEIKGFLVAGLMTLLFLGLYNTFFKGFLPTGVRSFVGLG